MNSSARRAGARGGSPAGRAAGRPRRTARASRRRCRSCRPRTADPRRARAAPSLPGACLGVALQTPQHRRLRLGERQRLDAVAVVDADSRRCRRRSPARRRFASAESSARRARQPGLLGLAHHAVVDRGEEPSAKAHVHPPSRARCRRQGYGRAAGARHGAFAPSFRRATPVCRAAGRAASRTGSPSARLEAPIFA